MGFQEYEPVWPAGSGPSGPETAESQTLAWMKQGVCQNRDPELFFAQGRGNLGSIQTAKKICREKCTVIQQCREYALEENIVHGVWGGLSSHQRANIRARRRRELKAS